MKYIRNSFAATRANARRIYHVTYANTSRTVCGKPISAKWERNQPQPVEELRKLANMCVRCGDWIAAVRK